VPFLSLVHLRELTCAQCGKVLAAAGARSFIVDADGNPAHFSKDDPPAEIVVELTCRNGHATELNVPNEIAAEETLTTPEEAPIATDAVILSGTSEAGKALPNDTP
jgi:hypothetical protein